MLHTFVSRPHNVIKQKAEWMSLSKIDPNDVVSDPISDYLEKRSQWTQLAAPSFLKGVRRPGILHSGFLRQGMLQPGVKPLRIYDQKSQNQVSYNQGVLAPKVLQ